MANDSRRNPPWMESQSLGGFYVYVPRTDEIYLQDGRHYPRPANIPRSALGNAAYDGPLPPPRQIPQQYQQLPQYRFSPSNSPPTGASLPMNANLAASMAQMNLAPRQTQHITAASGAVEVVFHNGRTQSQIQRREPPSINARGVAINKPEITGTLFKAYKVRTKPKNFFKIGKVFLVLWSEPAGGTSLVSKWATGTVINHLGERVFSKVRRFVVIREGGSYCNALPINTYTGRGVAKPGVNKSEHVIIYTGSNPPRPTPQELPRRGEPGMRSVPIQVDPDSRDEMLDPMSRLDLGGVTKVEHNIKVKALGNVNKRYLDALRLQYVNVQNQQAGVGPSTVLPQYALHANTPQQAAESDDDDDDDNNDDQSEDDDNDEENDDEEDDDDDDEEEDDDDQANDSSDDNNNGSDDDDAANSRAG